MEDISHSDNKSAPGNKALFEEKMTKSSSPGGDQRDDHQVSVDEINKEENQMDIKHEEESSRPPPPPPNKKHSTIIKDQDKEDQVESIKAKMGKVKEENERLKLLLSQVVKDYKSLQMRFLDILQQEEAKKSTETTAPSHQENEGSDDIVFLSLGRSSASQEARKEEKKSSYNGKELDEKLNHNNEGLALGLEYCKFELPVAASTEVPAAEKNPSSESSFGKAEEEQPSEIWPPSKVLKTVRNGDIDQEASEQMQLKKTRVSVRARCDTPTMNDGCQWRKYGQKIAKGNPCPRAYYRCTFSPTCPVRKQVQRCAEDMSILITTYEGNHNHPLPLSATAMASTTSAAASMLQSQSSSSQPGLGTSVSAGLAASTSSASANQLHGLNFNLISQNSMPPYQDHFPNSTISTSNSHPTITLDLTAPANSSYFTRLSNAPRYSSSSTLNFSSSSSSSLEGSWSTAGHFDHVAFPSHNISFGGALNIGGREPINQEHMYRSYTQTTNQQTPSQRSLSGTITAATEVITLNPSFRSALAAALSSFVFNGGGAPRENLHGGNTAHRAAVDHNEVGCASSHLERTSSMSSHQQQQKQGSLPLFPTSLSFPTSKSNSSGSPADNSNHIK